MIVLPAVLLGARLWTTMTFSEVLHHMHDDYRQLHGFQEELTAVVNGKPATFRTVRKIDGERSFCAMYVNDGLFSESISNGKTYWTLQPYTQSYTQTEERNPEFIQAFAVDKYEEGGFYFQAEGAYNMHFLLQNAHVTAVGDGTLDGKKFRTVKIAGGPAENKEAATGTIYFELDSFVVHRFEITYNQDDGTPYSFVVTSKQMRGVSFKADDFELDKKLVEGYVRKGDMLK
jgi:hypothetical protein